MIYNRSLININDTVIYLWFLRSLFALMMCSDEYMLRASWIAVLFEKLLLLRVDIYFSVRENILLVFDFKSAINLIYPIKAR